LDLTIASILTLDGVTNGAVYALLALATVLVFAVTRVIFIPQGEFVAYGALTLALLQLGQVPGTVWLLAVLALAAALLDAVAGLRRGLPAAAVALAAAKSLAFPLAVVAVAWWAAPRQLPLLLQSLLTLAIVTPLGPLVYRLAYEKLADATVLVLLIVSVGTHFALTGLGLVFFGAEGLRGPALSNTALTIGPLRFTGQSLAVYGLTIAFIIALWLFFGFTRMGKALRATAVNRLGARLVGIRTTLSGQIAFLLASLIGAISGILIVPITTLYYDTGFLIGLKGFIAAIIGGLVSYPLTAVAALIVGSVEAFSSFYASNFKEVIVFTLILPVLVLRSLAAPAVEEEKD
jgi:branched-chain amino acid transport system permease protein